MIFGKEFNFKHLHVKYKTKYAWYPIRLGDNR